MLLIVWLLLSGAAAAYVGFRSERNRGRRAAVAFLATFVLFRLGAELFYFLIRDMDGTQGFWFISLLLLLGNMMISILFARRNYRKNPQRETLPRLLWSAGAYLLVSCLISAALFPFWIFLGYATYDPNEAYKQEPSSSVAIEDIPTVDGKSNNEPPEVSNAR